MPRLARWYIKAGLVYLVLALLVGVLLQARTVIDLPGWAGRLQPVYLHLLIVGWITQLIIGVAYWMFPKFTREQPRGSETLGWLTFGLINAGLALRTIAEPQAGDLGWVLAASAVLQVIAGWLFVINTWARVKER
jgi:hypothetical protein